MQKTVAVIGAGPAGLACAKAALDYGLQPTVFESSSQLGGVWQPGKNGSTWPEMRTNISRWTMSFSDYPWAEIHADFPTSLQVHRYLAGYADHFSVSNNIVYNARVDSLAKSNGKWIVNSRAGRFDQFDAAIVASGIFAKPFLPDFATPLANSDYLTHSTQYRRSPDWQGKAVVVIAGSFSGIEIANDLAEQGATVTLIMPRSLWIVPRQVPTANPSRTIPIDLFSNVRRPSTDSPEEANFKKANFLQTKFGNPGDLHPALYIKPDPSPVYVAISDNFGPHILSGAITPIIGRATGISSSHVFTEDGKSFRADHVIACTGSEIDLSMLDRPIQRLLHYDPSDKLVPYLAEYAVRPDGVDDLFLVGTYRGPYFGVMELQARWVASMVAEDAVLSTPSLKDEQSIRQARPRPQFPHGNYIAFSDAIAQKIGVMPDLTDPLFLETPVIPAHYRDRGPHAKPPIVRAAVQSVQMRLVP